MDSKRLKAKDYARIAFKYGFVFASLLIMVTEISWDALANVIGIKGISREIIGSFFRAALLEELFKFLAFRKADKEYNFENEKEYILGAGVIGLTYGAFEKFALLNPFAIILGILFPFHMLWQMNQGSHLYRYRIAKENNDNKKAKCELFMATGLIFILHGCWDALISIGTYLVDKEGIAASIGSIIIIFIIVVGIIYIILSIKKLRKVLKGKETIKKKSKTK